MTIGLADTSVFVAGESGRSVDVELLPDELLVSIVTIAELRVGVLAAADLATKDKRLSTLARALEFEPVAINGLVADAWARLRIALHDEGRRMPINDSWIAATAISLGVPVVTQDDDYADVPGLDVIKV